MCTLKPKGKFGIKQYKLARLLFCSKKPFAKVGSRFTNQEPCEP